MKQSVNFKFENGLRKIPLKQHRKVCKPLCVPRCRRKFDWKMSEKIFCSHLAVLLFEGVGIIVGS